MTLGPLCKLSVYHQSSWHRLNNTLQTASQHGWGGQSVFYRLSFNQFYLLFPTWYAIIMQFPGFQETSLSFTFNLQLWYRVFSSSIHWAKNTAILSYMHSGRHLTITWVQSLMISSFQRSEWSEWSWLSDDDPVKFKRCVYRHPKVLRHTYVVNLWPLQIISACALTKCKLRSLVVNYWNGGECSFL